MPLANLTLDLARSLDPTTVLTDAGITPDPWQVNVLTSAAPRQLMCCCRQSGKSTVAAGAALHEALFNPGSLTLLVSPALRQTQELFRKVLDLFRQLDGTPDPTAESALRLEFSSGSRIVSLPGSEGTIRGYSAPSLIVVDEAAHAPDSLLHAVLPMLAVSQGRLVVPSTPNGKAGWFYEAWHDETDRWERTLITWEDCPRISADAVDLYRRTAGELAFRQEFCCEFMDTTEAVFPLALIDAAYTGEVSAWTI